MFSRNLFTRVFAAVSLALFVAGGCFSQTTNSDADGGLRIEMPVDGHVRIENQFGKVAAEVWKEKYLSVSTNIDDGSSFKRSPVVIENRTKLLAISIVRRPGDPAAAVNLTVRIPETTHLEIITGKHTATLLGLPLTTSLKSISGEVKVEFVGPANADINARSVSGSVKSELPQLRTDSGRVLQARIGSGGPSLKINTQSGAITLYAVEQPARSEVVARKLLEPDVVETPTKAAGLPAPVSDVQEISEGDVIRVDSQLVALNMSVVDRTTQRGLLGLTKSDFRLFENGSEQQILQFESSSAPFDLLLLIDLSGSTRDVLKLIRAAALRFVDAARPSDRIGVITFAGSPTVVSSLTLNRQLLRQRINAMDTAPGDTKLYDATDFALIQLLQDAKSRRRTAVILMSDGLDNSIDGVQGVGSTLPYKDLLSRVQEFDGVLYTLWLNTEYEALSPLDTQPEAFDSGHDRMKEMADSGGGIFYEVERLEDLAGAYERVVADLGTVYSLAYRPLDKTRDGKWRAIRVTVERPSAIARGKRGYYAN
ncbi:MAG: VWA domain-containing protein [Acidobacteriota bacterium]|nr:VWA domain-containing protein [Acidobacteriota bacterium]